MNQYTLTIFARKYSDILTKLNFASIERDSDKVKSLEVKLDKMFDNMCIRFGKDETEKAIATVRDRKKDKQSS